MSKVLTVLGTTALQVNFIFEIFPNSNIVLEPISSEKTFYFIFNYNDITMFSLYFLSSNIL